MTGSILMLKTPRRLSANSQHWRGGNGVGDSEDEMREEVTLEASEGQKEKRVEGKIGWR